MSIPLWSFHLTWYSFFIFKSFIWPWLSFSSLKLHLSFYIYVYTLFKMMDKGRKKTISELRKVQPCNVALGCRVFKEYYNDDAGEWMLHPKRIGIPLRNGEPITDMGGPCRNVGSRDGGPIDEKAAAKSLALYCKPVELYNIIRSRFSQRVNHPSSNPPFTTIQFLVLTFLPLRGFHLL